MENVADTLMSAIVASLANLSPSNRDQGLAGYALIVDADLKTVYGAAASREFIDDQGDESVLFLPVDWPLEYHSAEFRNASEQNAHLSDAPYETRASALVDCMMAALERSRGTEASLERALLLVVCADGGGVWDRLEGDAVRRLNGRAVYEQWIGQRRDR